MSNSETKGLSQLPDSPCTYLQRGVPVSPRPPSGEGVLRDSACATNESSDILLCAEFVGVLFWSGRVFGRTRLPEGDGSVNRKEPR